MCSQCHTLFQRTGPQKTLESIQFSFGRRLVCRILDEIKQPAVQTKGVQHFGVFFHQIKVCQRIGRKDHLHAACRRMRRLEAFLYLAGQT